MSDQTDTSPQINVPTDAVLAIVIAQRNKAQTDLATAQAVCQQLAARVRELESTRPQAQTGTHGG